MANENPKPVTTGRGGAGNMSSKPVATVNQNDLVTPNIKSDIYTTGRGGKGNMAKFDKTNPEEARQAQDINPALRRAGAGPTSVPTSKPKQAGITTGRGGGGNIARNPNQSHSRERKTTPGKLSAGNSPAFGPVRRNSDDYIPEEEAIGAGDAKNGVERQSRPERRFSGLAEKGRDALRRVKSGSKGPSGRSGGEQ